MKRRRNTGRSVFCCAILCVSMVLQSGFGAEAAVNKVTVDGGSINLTAAADEIVEGGTILNVDAGTSTVADTEPPTIELTAEGGFENWYTTGVELSLTVTDGEGLSSVRAFLQGEVLFEEKLDNSLKTLQKAEDGEILTENNDTVTENNKKAAETDEEAVEPVRMYSRVFTLTSLQVDGMASLVIEASDINENHAQTEHIICIDGNAPIIIGTGMEENSMHGEAYQGELVIIEKNPVMETMNFAIEHDTLFGFHISDPTEEAVVDETAGTITIPVELREEGNYQLSLGITDKASNRGELVEHFMLDLEPPVVKGFEELNGKYYDAFHLNMTIDEMVEDMSEVTAGFWLDGVPFSPDRTVTTPGLHVLKGVFTDAFCHETTQVIRFVVRARQESILHRAEQALLIESLEPDDVDQNFSEDTKEKIRNETGKNGSGGSEYSLPEEIAEQGKRLQSMLEIYGSRILRWVIVLFVISAAAIILLSICEKRE